MEVEEISGFVKTSRNTLKRMNVTPRTYPPNWTFTGVDQGLGLVHYLLDDIESAVRRGGIGRAQELVGAVQGFFLARGLIPVGDVRTE